MVEDDEEISALEIAFYIREAGSTICSNYGGQRSLHTELSANVVAEHFHRMGSERFSFVMLKVLLQHEGISSASLYFESRTLRIFLNLPATVWPFIQTGTAENPLCLSASFKGFELGASSSYARIEEYSILRPQPLREIERTLKNAPSS